MFGVLKVFSGHRELLDSLLCDVVVVSTPNMTHYQILMDIINHRKPHHVLVEKPLCTTVAHCKEVGLSEVLLIMLAFHYHMISNNALNMIILMIFFDKLNWLDIVFVSFCFWTKLWYNELLSLAWLTKGLECRE